MCSIRILFLDPSDMGSVDTENKLLKRVDVESLVFAPLSLTVRHLVTAALLKSVSDLSPQA